MDNFHVVTFVVASGIIFETYKGGEHGGGAGKGGLVSRSDRTGTAGMTVPDCA